MNVVRDGILAMLVWASAFPGIREGLTAYEPLELILLRFTVASAFLFFLLYWKHRPKWPEKQDWPRFIALGLLGITAYQIPLNYGQKTVPAGTASLIINTAPLWASLFSCLQLRERMTRYQIIGLGLGFLGVALIALGQGRTIAMGPGIVLVFLAALAHSGSFIIQKPLLEKYSPLMVTAFTVLFGMLPLLPWAPDTYHATMRASWIPTLTVVYLGIFPAAVAYVLWNRVVAKLPVSRAASFLYLIPPFSMLIAWLWHREIPSLMSVAGGAIAFSGVALARIEI